MPTILSKDVGHRKAILKLLLSKGYKWHGENNYTPDSIEKYFPYRKWSVIQIKTENKSICGSHFETSITHKSIFELSNYLDNITGRKVVGNYEE